MSRGIQAGLSAVVVLIELVMASFIYEEYRTDAVFVAAAGALVFSAGGVFMYLVLLFVPVQSGT